jgi:hypothetical protein
MNGSLAISCLMTPRLVLSRSFNYCGSLREDTAQSATSGVWYIKTQMESINIGISS